MLVLTQPIAICIVLLEPPVVPAHDRFVDLIQKLAVAIYLIEFIGSPCDERWLGHIGIHGKVKAGNGALVMDCVRNHAIFALVIEHNPDLILRKILLYIAIGKGM